MRIRAGPIGKDQLKPFKGHSSVRGYNPVS